MTEAKIYKITKILLILIPIFVLGYLWEKDLVWSGEMVVEKDFAQSSPFILDFFPSERMSAVGRDANGYYQSITSEPVYFDLKVPRPFSRIKAEITYDNKDIPILNLGAQASPFDWEYQMKTLENQYIDQLNWPKITDNGITLFQKEKKFDSVDSFLKNLPATNKIAVYDYDLNYDFKIPDYQPKNGLEINKTIRGRHTLYTYVGGGEPLDFTFTIQDINRHAGADPFEAVVYSKNNKVYSTILPDDGITDESGQASAKRDLNISLKDLPAGVYKIELRASDDIFIRQIKTKEHYLVFANRIYLADNEDYADSLSDIKTEATNLYTSGRKITFQTAHQEAQQTAKIDGDNLEIAEIQSRYSYNVSSKKKAGELAKIYTPKNDVAIETDGLFAFSQESFFNPLLTSLRSNLDLDQGGIGYLITSYASPEKQGESKIAKIEFNPNQFYFNNNQLRLVFSLPDITAGQEVKLRKIKLILEREPITWGNFWLKAKNYIWKIFGKN